MLLNVEPLILLEIKMKRILGNKKYDTRWISHFHVLLTKIHICNIFICRMAYV